jgi:hypothetical protein
LPEKFKIGNGNERVEIPTKESRLTTCTWEACYAMTTMIAISVHKKKTAE